MKNEHSRIKLPGGMLHIGEILPISVTVLITLLLISSAWAAAPSASAPDASGYEISLGELKKVKKDRPVKKEIKVRRKKVKSESMVERPSNYAVEKSGAPDQLPVAVPSVLDGATTSENKAGSASGKTASSEISTGSVTIHHDPYSYVITGKRTVIQAVISSADSIQAVYCRFRAVENSSSANVPMAQVSGTQFTYGATLPSLAAASRSLRYSIIVVDSSGAETRSREFVIAVKPSAVLPGWQLENSPEMIKIKLENREKPLDGFSDPGIIVE